MSGGEGSEPAGAGAGVCGGAGAGAGAAADGLLEGAPTLPGARVVVTTRALGDLKDPAARRRLARRLACEPGRIVRGRQVHGVRVAEVTPPDDTPRATAEVALPVRGPLGALAPLAPDEAGGWVAGDAERGADALVTQAKGLWLLSLAADCLPVALACGEVGAVAVAHAGWRGAVGGIAGLTARALVDRYGAAPDHIEVLLGPCIGPCCYEVGEEVAAVAVARPGGEEAVWRSRAGGRPRLDLAALARADLLAAGLDPARIRVVDRCTRCEPDVFFSHRGQATPARFGLAIARAG